MKTLLSCWVALALAATVSAAAQRYVISDDGAVGDGTTVSTFNLEWNMRINVAGDERVPPTVRHVKIIGVHGTAASAGVIHGIPDSFVDGVTFEDCAITAGKGLVISNAKNIDTSGLKLQVKEGEPVVWKP